MGGQGSGVRRILAALLTLIAAVSLVAGAVSLAARRTLYQATNAPDVAARLLDEPAVRQAIAEKLTARLRVLDPRLREETVSQRLDQLAEITTTTDGFRAAFTAAVVALQRDLLEGGAPQVVLRMDDMLAALQDGLEQTGGDLPIPQGEMTGVLVIDREQVQAYRRLDDVSRQVGWPAIAIGVLAAMGAVLVTERRRGAILGVGATVAAAALLALGGLALSKSVAAGEATTAKGQDAVDAVWDVVARDIRTALAIVLLAGLAGAVGGLTLQAFRGGRVTDEYVADEI
jgi:hypothetical protein